MKWLSSLALALLIIAGSCKDKPENDGSSQAPELIPVEPDGGIGDGALSLDDAIISRIEKAHNKSRLKEGEAVQFRIDLNFGGQDRLDGTLTTTPGNDRIRIDYEDGRKLIFNGEKVALTPNDAETSGARFAVFTWAYFFSFPYKLNDGGTNFKMTGEAPLKDGAPFETFKLTFNPGTGDAPDDWYVGYLNPDGSIRAAAYIVTYNSDKQAAEESPHAIIYDDYQNFNGIPFASKWTFYNWEEQAGIIGEPLGHAHLSQFKVFRPEPGFFEISADAQIVPSPGKS